MNLKKNYESVQTKLKLKKIQQKTKKFTIYFTSSNTWSNS